MDFSDKPAITFYDIIMDPKAYPCAPNPWKARYALNFAKVPYRTAWTPLGAIASTRDTMSLAASRKNMDGSDFPTLPVIKDPTSGEGEVAVGDSFEIALHLQDRYLSAAPPSEQLFPGDAVDGGTVALHREWNAMVDRLVTIHGVVLAGCYMSFDPRTADADKAAMMARMPGDMKLMRWDDLEIPSGPDRERMVRGFEEVLDAEIGPHYPQGAAGPFMNGRESPMYADFILGGWLQFMRGLLPDWEEMRNTWSGGKWGRLFDALEQWAAVDGREGVAPSRR